MASLVISAALAVWGLGLTFKGNSLNKSMLALTQHQDSLSRVQTEISNIQLAISKKQDTTSLDLAHFSTLLDKTDSNLDKQSELVSLSNRQIDSLVALNRILSKEYELQRQIRIEGQSLALNEKFNTYNIFGDIGNEIGNETYLFRFNRNGMLKISMPSMNERLTKLNNIYLNISELKNPWMYFPNTTIPAQLSGCINAISGYRRICSNAINIGTPIDTGDQHEFNAVIYSVIDLEDSLAKYLPVYREKAKKEVDVYNKKYNLIRYN